MEAINNRPKIGLALSGASTRAVFYIGFLEVLAEYNIPIDYIAASSSGSIVAMAYASGMLPQLKDHVMRLSKEDVFDYLGKVNYKSTGLYSMDGVEEILRHYSRGLNFEDVRPLMGFVAVDIHKGEQVVLSMGDMAHAARISCTLPLLLEPAEWGENLLVDGGLLNIVPIDVVKRAGMDILIAIDMPGARHIFREQYIKIRKVYNTLKKYLLINGAAGLLRRATATLANTGLEVFDFAVPERQKQYTHMFSVLGRCLDIAAEAQARDYTFRLRKGLDFFIRPVLKRKEVVELDKVQTFYQSGRECGQEYAPQIAAAIKNYEQLAANNEYETIKF